MISEKTAYLEKEFLETVFYPEFGDAGLERLSYQKKIYDSGHRRSYYIDFVVHAEGNNMRLSLMDIIIMENCPLRNLKSRRRGRMRLFAKVLN